MGILFLVALLFAIPTGGGSIVLWGAVAAGLAWQKGRAARLADIEHAARDIVGKGKMAVMPTWASDRVKRASFITTLLKRTVQSGIPLSYVSFMLKEGDNLDTILLFVGSLEIRGGSYLDQLAATERLLKDAWDSLPHDRQRAALQLG